MAIAFDTVKLFLRRDDAEGGPSANHGRTLPPLDVSRDSADLPLRFSMAFVVARDLRSNSGKEPP